MGGEEFWIDVFSSSNYPDIVEDELKKIWKSLQ
jgi:hypothetical protein